MKRTFIALALVLLAASSAIASKPDFANNGNGVGKGKPDKPNPNKPTGKPEKPPKVFLETEGWVELADDAVARGMLRINSELEGKAIAAAKGCVHRKTVLQASCSKPGPIPFTIYQYRAMEQYRCPGEKRVRHTFFARTYTPPTPTPGPIG